MPPSQEDQLAAEALEALRESARISVSPPPPRITQNNSLLTKVSSHPLVSSAVNIYNSSKSFSPRFKYSAEKIESVIIPRKDKDKDKDKMDISGSTTPVNDSPTTNVLSKPISNSSSIAPTPTRTNGRPKWRRVLVTATSLASLSSDSRQRLRYCLRFLKIANAHLASKVSSLQELLEEEAAHAMAQQIASNHVPPDRKPPKKYTISSLKQEIITTVKKVVTVVSNFAGNSLPEPARTHVRNYILRLPAKWALTLGSQAHTPRTPGTPTSTMVGPSTANSIWAATGTTTGISTSANASTTTLLNRNIGVNSESPPPLSDGTTTAGSVLSTELTSEETLTTTTSNTFPPAPAPPSHSEVEVGGRVLSLARESLIMLEQITSIVDETLEKAESWCEKLGRTRRKNQAEQKRPGNEEEVTEDEYEDDDSLTAPPTSIIP